MSDWHKDLQSWAGFREDCSKLDPSALLDRVVILAKEVERLQDLLALSREELLAEHRSDAEVGANIRAALASGWAIVGTRGTKEFRITDTWAQSETKPRPS